jgi:hypothetical protein
MLPVLLLGVYRLRKQTFGTPLPEQYTGSLQPTDTLEVDLAIDNVAGSLDKLCPAIA